MDVGVTVFGRLCVDGVAFIGDVNRGGRVVFEDLKSFGFFRLLVVRFGVWYFGLAGRLCWSSWCRGWLVGGLWFLSGVSCVST